MAQELGPLDALRDALTWLAASPERQIATLLTDGLGTGAEVLALAFDDALERLAWSRRPILPMETLEILEDLDAQLGGMAGDDDAWTMTALCERLEWQRVRRLATRALVALSPTGRTLERPTIRLQ
jgi:hypothetical protein